MSDFHATSHAIWPSRFHGVKVHTGNVRSIAMTWLRGVAKGDGGSRSERVGAQQTSEAPVRYVHVYIYMHTMYTKRAIPNLSLILRKPLTIIYKRSRNYDIYTSLETRYTISRRFIPQFALFPSRYYIISFADYFALLSLWTFRTLSFSQDDY